MLRLPQSPEELVERLRFLHEERKKFPRPPRRLSLTTEQRADVLHKTDSRCHLCGGEITESKFAADHVLSHAAGGEHKLANYLPAHGLCNCATVVAGSIRQRNFSGFSGWDFGHGKRWRTKRRRSARIYFMRSGNTRRSCQKDAANAPADRGGEMTKEEARLNRFSRRSARYASRVLGTALRL